MAKTRLLHAVCTIAMLAAVPALAQTNTETGSTGAGGAPNNPTAQGTTPNQAGGQSGSANMAPAGKPMGSHAGMESHSTHRTAIGRSARGPSAQDAAVDQLNDQSYQAARNGQAFNGASASSGPGSTMTPSSSTSGGSGSMSDMPGGSTSTGTSSSNGSK